MHEQFPTPRPPDAQRERAEQLRKEVLLVCPKNDAESDLILQLATHAGIRAYQSNQLHGARLEKENRLPAAIQEAGKPHVWIVEMPGPALEQELREQGYDVHLIDHHGYQSMDRATDPTTGERLPSSLAQFLTKAEITDEELAEWGYDPKTVHGIGIMDEAFVEGLRKAGYTQEELNRVLDTNAAYARANIPDFEEIAEAAKEAWKARKTVDGYTVVTSDYHKDIRGAISQLTVREGKDTEPIVISSVNGAVIHVQQVPTAITEHLMKTIKGNTFTFGNGQCWGIDSRKGGAPVSLDVILKEINNATK